MVLENTFLYSVYPKRVIKELPTTTPIRTPKSLYLTKDQVKICLKYGSVYRRFANEKRNEKVTILNVDRLHNATFMTEEEYDKFKDSLVSDKRGSVIVTGEETKMVEEEHNKIKNSSISDKKEPVINKEVVNNEQSKDEKIVNTSSTVEENKKETEETSTNIEENKNNNSKNYYNNGKNNKNKK